jgi:hypothetical protein
LLSWNTPTRSLGKFHYGGDEVIPRFIGEERMQDVKMGVVKAGDEEKANH